MSRDEQPAYMEPGAHFAAQRAEQEAAAARDTTRSKDSRSTAERLLHGHVGHETGEYPAQTWLPALPDEQQADPIRD